MADNVFLLSIPGLRKQDLARMPTLAAMAADGDQTNLVPSFPCVTCPVQANMTTGCLPSEHGVVANGFFWREKHEVEMWTAWNDCILRPQIWDRLHDDDPAITSAVWFRAAQQGRRRRPGVHARADPQSRRIGIVVVLHEADGNVRHAARHAGPFSRCRTFGARYRASARPTGFVTRPSGRPNSPTPTSSISTCRISTTPPKSWGPTARPPDGPWPSLTPRSAGSWPASSGPTPRGSRCGSWPANTRSCRSTTSSIPTRCCARRACCTSKKSRTASGSTW